MAQCVCGQYSQPGDVQCRYCGRPLDAYSAAGPSYDAYNAAPYDAYAAEAPYDPYKAAPASQQPQPPKPIPFPTGYPAVNDARTPAQPPAPAPHPPKSARAADSSEMRQFMHEMRAAVNSIKRNTTVTMVVVIAFAVLSVGISLFSLILCNSFLDWLRSALPSP